jgi:hypothetical protein
MECFTVWLYIWREYSMRCVSMAGTDQRFFFGKERDFIAQTRPWYIIYSYDNTLMASNCRGEFRHIRDRTLLVSHCLAWLRHIRDGTLLVSPCRGELRHIWDRTLLGSHCRGGELRHIRNRTLFVSLSGRVEAYQGQDTLCYSLWGRVETHQGPDTLCYSLWGRVETHQGPDISCGSPSQWVETHNRDRTLQVTTEASWDLHKETKIMEIQTYPDRLCGPPSSLFNGYQEYFSGGNAAGSWR